MELDPSLVVRGNGTVTGPVAGNANLSLPFRAAGQAAAAWRWPWSLPRTGVALGVALAGLLVIGLALDAADLVARAFASGWAPGLVVIGLVSVAVGSLLKLSLDEASSLRRLREIDGLRAEAERIRTVAGYGRSLRYADSLGDFYVGREELVPAFATLRRQLTDAHTDAEVIRLVDRNILVPLDQQAYRLVLNGARDTALATALSPSAALDMVIVLWRNLKMLREVASLYGARPGPLGSVRLLRRMLASLAVAGISEGAQHVAADALGGSLAAAVSTRMGQGVINGLLTARVGLAAMHLCRPIAFEPENQPSLKRIRSELMSVPKQVL